MINTTIQLRQKDKGASVYGNGDYENHLAVPVVIESGDRVAITNAFVDTTDYSNQQIILDQDLNIGMNIIYYMNNQRASGTPSEYLLTYQTGMEKVDMDDYVVCRFYGDDPDYAVLDSITFKRYNNGNWGGFTVEFEYITIVGSSTDKPILSISVAKQDQFTEEITINPASIVFDSEYGLVIKAVYDDVPPALPVNRTLSYFNTSLSEITDNELDTSIFIPYEVPINFTVPAGRYNPNDLCSIINKKVVEAQSLLISNDTQNLYVNNTGILSMVGLYTWNTAGTGVESGLSTPENGYFSFNKSTWTPPLEDDQEKDYYQVINAHQTPKLMMGTNLFELEYNQSTNIFEFNFLHFPLYHTNTDIESIVCNIKNSSGQSAFEPYIDPKTFWCSKNSGISFTHLSPAWFWSGQLGMNLNTVLTKITYSPQVILETRGNNFVDYRGVKDGSGSAENLCPKFNAYDSEGKTDDDYPSLGFTSGLNTTEGLIVADAMVIKSQASPFLAKPYAGLDLDVVIGTTTNSVKGGQNALNFVIDSGYYLIELNTKFENKLIGQNFYNNMIQGVINRYYSINTYTAGGQGLTYIHPDGAEPILLDSLHTRILLPDGSLANLGEDNSIFLTITKNTASLIKKTPPKKKK